MTPDKMNLKKLKGNEKKPINCHSFGNRNPRLDSRRRGNDNSGEEEELNGQRVIEDEERRISCCLNR